MTRKTAARAQMMKGVIEDYLLLGDSLRMSALPGWIAAELSLSQLKAIFLLDHFGVLTVSALAKRLGVGNPAASVLVQQMVTAGLAERSAGAQDRRQTFVRLTARGAGLIASRREQTQNQLRRCLEALTDGELAGLGQGLSALREAAQSEAEPGAAGGPAGGQAARRRSGA